MYLIGVIIVSKQGTHLKMGFLEARLQSESLKNFMEIINNLVMLVIIAIFFWWSVDDITTSIQREEKSMTMMIGMWTVRSAFVVGSFLSSIHLLIHLRRSIRHFFKLEERAK
jgi:TRAP-type C4-dicarboxylate transport system permease small subunit